MNLRRSNPSLIALYLDDSSYSVVKSIGSPKR